MKDWNFQVNTSPEEISKKLESSLGDRNRFVFKTSREKIDSIKFKIRKRLLLAFEVNVQNNIIVNGRILRREPNTATNVKISFTHHPLAKLLMYGHVILGLGLLAGIIFEINRSSYAYLVVGILLITGILTGMHLKSNFNKNVEDYKKLIGEILEPKTLK
ncbi:DUF423 domain-containing protein [Salinimicrobium sp. MT39]|uniref:DUF423 domain-containing protein n=1 Tax=Salinimicrobium profundisediminis TaxID=2994553 RepID=A0A9X3CUJ8_9FLAO|nr:DUF423 domain-containing protein [Salinimicrobium profundisediminis]MCX2836808.1 DUF423 domain-containing protein [Salinimicrobium profundisediminis]